MDGPLFHFLFFTWVCFHKLWKQIPLTPPPAAPSERCFVWETVVLFSTYLEQHKHIYVFRKNHYYVVVKWPPFNKGQKIPSISCTIHPHARLACSTKRHTQTHTRTRTDTHVHTRTQSNCLQLTMHLTRWDWGWMRCMQDGCMTEREGMAATVPRPARRRRRSRCLQCLHGCRNLSRHCKIA